MTGEFFARFGFFDISLKWNVEHGLLSLLLHAHAICRNALLNSQLIGSAAAHALRPFDNILRATIALAPIVAAFIFR